MIRTEGKKIIMVEKEFGISLPIIITGATISSNETIEFTIKKNDGTNLIEPKKYLNVENNTFDLMFSKEESVEMKPGTYFYSIDWYNGDIFLANIVKNELFVVEDR